MNMKGSSLLVTSLILLGVMFSSLLGRSGSDTYQRHFELRAESEKFWNLLDRNAKLRKVGSGFGFTEGPVWDPAGFLYVSDEEQNKIFQLSLDGTRKELISLGDPDGNKHSASYHRRDTSGQVQSDRGLI